MSNQLMTLKDLKGSMDRLKTPVRDPILNRNCEIDTDIACTIVDTMFDQISRCLQEDRSRVKVNVLTKGVVLGLLGDRTKNGMKEYLTNMYDNDIKELLDDIQKALDRRSNKNL